MKQDTQKSQKSHVKLQETFKIDLEDEESRQTEEDEQYDEITYRENTDLAEGQGVSLVRESMVEIHKMHLIQTLNALQMQAQIKPYDSAYKMKE